MASRNNATLIIGGTGKTGSRVAKRLRARGIDTRIGSRAGTPPFDWNDPGTFAPALRGVSSIYVTFQPDLAVPHAAERVRSLTAMAIEQGVERLVLLSGRGEPQVLASEQAIRESGRCWTIVRAAFFAQNFSEGLWLDEVLGGEVAFPWGSTGEPFVDADDIADVVALALTEEAHAGQIYELTGPRLLTFADAVSEIARASGRAVRHVPVTPEDYAAGLRRFMPEPDAAFMLELFGALLDGHNAHLSQDIARLLGRPPKDFSAYALDAARAGAWQQRAQ